MVLVMHAVRLGPLDKKAEPKRRANIPVIEKLGYCSEQGVVGARGYGTTEQRKDDRGTEY
jgi:hypothetical protein